ncbi:hypothetical protein E2542_SST08466 [Spatholobus suberectus]|nr:hypothetical protein E2542_SST08466 [Spatholobus suberectus]
MDPHRGCALIGGLPSMPAKLQANAFNTLWANPSCELNFMGAMVRAIRDEPRSLQRNM